MEWDGFFCGRENLIKYFFDVICGNSVSTGSARCAQLCVKRIMCYQMKNKSNMTTIRPLGIYLIGISKYILNRIHFLMILANFGVFSFMVTDGRTYGHTDGQTLI